TVNREKESRVSAPLATHGPTPTTTHGRLMLTAHGRLTEFDHDLIHTLPTKAGNARSDAASLAGSGFPGCPQSHTIVAYRNLGVAIEYERRLSSLNRIALRPRLQRVFPNEKRGFGKLYPRTISFLEFLGGSPTYADHECGCSRN